MKKKIAVLGGGDSPEFKISVQSADMVRKWIDSEKYESYLVRIKGTDWSVITEDGQSYPIDKSDFSIVFYNEHIKFDAVIMAIHGTPGENGILQSYFELLKIPYNTCDVFTSALTFNKFATKAFLKEFDILSAKGILIRKGKNFNIETIAKQLGFPCFVKPNASGSSCGVSKAKNITELEEAINKAFIEDNEILIEEAIKGTEVTHGLIKFDKKEFLFPVTEVVPKTEFFDYHAKYHDEKSEEITPARISDDLTVHCQQLSSKIYDSLGCKGIVRIDYIIKDNQFYFLEINTVPGMSPKSIVPQQIKAMGMTVTEMYNMIIEDIIKK